MIHQNEKKVVFSQTDMAARLAAAVIGELVAYGYCNELLEEPDKVQARITIDIVANTIRRHLGQLDNVALGRMRERSYDLMRCTDMINLETVKLSGASK